MIGILTRIYNRIKKRVTLSKSILYTEKTNKDTTVYIGFSVDMDRAYSEYNLNNELIPKTHKDYDKIMNYANDFKIKTEMLIDYFYKNNYSEAVTWFVNEASYKITSRYPSILNKCISNGGELGLHTHFNSKLFSEEPHSMSDNADDWMHDGLIVPVENLKNFYNKDVLLFKSGNHLRNDAMFSSLSEIGIKIDCTKIINHKREVDKKVFFNDQDIKLGSLPFFIQNENGVILEIPEILTDFAIKHVENSKKRGLSFVKLQIHHWEFDTSIPKFNNLIKELKDSGYKVEFASLLKMQEIFFRKLSDDYELIILNDIKRKLKKDSYYISKKGVFDKNFIDVMVFIFNNYSNKIKILELFAGIGQYSYLLNQLKFTNIDILDSRKDRVNFFSELNPISKDFFDYNLNNYDFIFATNAINSSLNKNIEIQIQKYSDFLSQKLNNTLLFNCKKYASYDNKVSDNIIISLQEKFHVYFLNNEYVVIKNVSESNNINRELLNRKNP